MDLSQTDFRDLRKVIHDLCGLVIGDEKQYLVKSRLQPVLEKNELSSYAALVQRLRHGGGAVLSDQIIEAITTNETSFNRDPHVFDALRRQVLPELAERMIQRRRAGTIAGQQARIWCAAVATGQEAYSVGMAIQDYARAGMPREITPNHFPILASDISRQALAAAAAGRYSPADVARGVTSEQRARYFQQDQGAWVVDDALRRMVLFQRQNLVQDRPGTDVYDLILCRNVLIYFDHPTRVRLVESIVSALRPKGILILGAAESLFGANDTLVAETVGSSTVYRKPAPSA